MSDLDRSALYEPSNEGPPLHPQWATRTRSRSIGSTNPKRPTTTWAKIQQFRRGVRKQVKKLSLAQKIGGAFAILFFFTLTILFLIYHSAFFAWLIPVAERWRQLRGGWLIIFFWAFFSGFPPVIGYSSCVTVSGFIYGFPYGWFPVAAGTVLGSTSAFIACRLYFRDFTRRLIAHDKRFAALALTLKHDGLKLLCMIRLCPLPYSISNGAMSTFPTVSPLSFALATAIATPKLLIAIFVGSRMALLGEDAKMDGKTKAINIASIVFSVILGAATGYIIYARTMKRANQLEAEERERARTDQSTAIGELFTDDPDELIAERTLSSDLDLDLERQSSNSAHVAPLTIKENVGARLLSSIAGLLGRKSNRQEDSESDSENNGRLLDGDEDDDDDAEELLVVDHDTLELEDNRPSRKAEHKRSSSQDLDLL